MMRHEELIPFFTHNDLYLQAIYEIGITVKLPKLRQIGQSVSNWEIRERIKKMLSKVEVYDFKVLESSLEEVHFAATVNCLQDCKIVIKTLDGISFHAIGFTEPLTINAVKNLTDNSLQSSEFDNGNPADTLYVGGLPFDWFRRGDDSSAESCLASIFEQFGRVKRVDIPQCHPCRKEMDPSISGMRQSVWSFGEDTFFEIYVQFESNNGFMDAINTLRSKLLVRKIGSGQLREAKIKVEVDKTAHLSDKKVRARRLYAAQLMRKPDFGKIESSDRAPSSSKIDVDPGVEEQGQETAESHVNGSNCQQDKTVYKEHRQRRSSPKKQFVRKINFSKSREENHEDMLRKKLEKRLKERLRVNKLKRETAAKRLLSYVAKMKEPEDFVVDVVDNGKTVNDIISEYTKLKGLPNESELRLKLLQRRRKCS